MNAVYRPKERRLPSLTAFIGSLVLALIASRLPIAGDRGRPIPADIARAATCAENAMRDAEVFIRERKIEAGILGEDPGRGLLGEELTELTTTLGSLSSKRTAEDPRWAAVLVERLWGAGLRAGDFVAAGLSGSFPGLNLALATACESLDIRLAAISSVTASTYGANQPGFTWPEIETRLVAAGLMEPVSVGIAAGGANDVAADLQPEGRALAEKIAKHAATALGARFLAPRDYIDAVSTRMTLYRDLAEGRQIALYVNVGGTEASLGKSTAVLELSSGFLPPLPFDISKDRGVMATMLEIGVPVLSLLNLRDLALRWGVPIDG